MWNTISSYSSIFDLHDLRVKNEKFGPFAVYRKVWSHKFPVIVENVHYNFQQPWMDAAYGFACSRDKFGASEWVPSNHFEYYKDWVDDLKIPNSGSYQWDYMDLDDDFINELIDKFYIDGPQQHRDKI